MLSRLASNRLVRWALVAVVVALAVIALERYWGQVRDAAVELSPLAVVGSFVAGAVGIAMSMLSWRCLLSDMGSALPPGAAARVFFLAQLGKYLPGSIWPFVAQVELGREHGVPRRRSATASVLVIGVSIMSGLAVAAVTLPFVSAKAAERYWWVLAVAPILAVALHPRILNPLIRRALLIVRRPPLEQPLTGRGILAAVGYATLGWLAFGLHIWLLVRELGGTDGPAFLASVGAYALAWTVGFVVVIAPAGVGVREVALAACLRPILDAGSVVLVVVASRLLVTIGDLGWAGVGVLLGRSHVAKARDEMDEAKAIRAAGGRDDAPEVSDSI